MKRLACLVAILANVAQPLSAEPIETACLKSERSRGQRALCGCIQDAANLTLSPRDQKLAATFFSDPHRAQDVRQSSRRSDSAFWERYENFSQTAQTFCQR